MQAERWARRVAARSVFPDSDASVSLARSLVRLGELVDVGAVPARQLELAVAALRECDPDGSALDGIRARLWERRVATMT